MKIKARSPVLKHVRDLYVTMHGKNLVTMTRKVPVLVTFLPTT